MPGLTIRQYGDPVLKERAREVEDIDGAVASLVESMIETMYAAPGTGLAANQVGVQRRIFVYDVGEGARTVINPRIVESDGEWAYDEGCLSVPGLSWEIVRPNAVHLVGPRPRRERDLHRGHRARGPRVPARARPPRRHPAGGAARRGPAQGGAQDPAHPHAGPDARPDPDGLSNLFSR